MNINIEQLREIWQMQQELDKRIHEKNGLKPEDTIDKRKIALIVELGELLQELPRTFKYWKKGAVDNKQKALEEFVDCLHFALSLTCYDDINSIDVGTIHEYNHELAIFWLLDELVNDGDYSHGTKYIKAIWRRTQLTTSDKTRGTDYEWLGYH